METQKTVRIGQKAEVWTYDCCFHMFKIVQYTTFSQFFVKSLVLLTPLTSHTCTRLMLVVGCTLYIHYCVCTRTIE